MENTSRIRTRTVSDGPSASGSYIRVHMVTEAQSVLPSFTSAFSLEGANSSLSLAGRQLADSERPESDRNVSIYPNPFDDPAYTDTVQSNDSTFSLLRRSLSVPADHRFVARSPKQNRPHCKEIFQDFLPKNDLCETDSVGSYGTTSSHQWRGTMVDLMEKPDYIDSLQSTSSGAALLASTARIIAAKGIKKSASLGALPEILDVRQEEKKLKKNIFILSLSFLLMFTAYISIRNLQSSLNSKGGLGTSALSSVYVMLFVGCVFATTIVQRLRPKPTMLVAMTANIVYITANSYPSYFTLIPAAGLVGFSLSLLWTAHATYMTSIAIRYAEVSGKNLMNVLSKFNGFFFMFFQCGQILSGVISSTVLMLQTSGGETTRTVEYITKNYTTLNVSLEVNGLENRFNSTGLINLTTESRLMNYAPEQYNWSTSMQTPVAPNQEACGPRYCNLEQTGSKVKVDAYILYILLGILLSIAVAGLIVMGLFLDKLEGVIKKSTASMKDQMFAVFKFFFDGKVMCLLPMMFYSLTEVAFMFGEFTKAYVTCTHGMYMVGYVMMCLSACGALSSYVNGKMQKYCGRVPLLVLAGSINLCLLIGMLIWEPTSDNRAILFVVAGIWGVADGIWATQIISLFSVLFHTHKEPAFAALKMCQSLAVATSFALSPYMCTQMKIIVLLVLLVLAEVGYLALEFQLHKQKQTHFVISQGMETPV